MFELTLHDRFLLKNIIKNNGVCNYTGNECKTCVIMKYYVAVHGFKKCNSKLALKTAIEIKEVVRSGKNIFVK